MSESDNNSFERKRYFRVLSLENLLQIGILLVAMASGFFSLKSDIRDAGTRITEHDREITNLRVGQERDREENVSLLRDLTSKVEVLLERTKPKWPGPARE